MSVERLFPSKLVAAVMEPEAIPGAIASPVSAVILRCGNILDLPSVVAVLRRGGKAVLIQADLIEGVAHDAEGIRLIAGTARPDAIITTRSHLIAAVRKEGLTAILHQFVIDNPSYQRALGYIAATRPDAFYLMPGLMPRVVRDLVSDTSVPIMAGGLIRHASEFRPVLEAGAVAVVSGTPSLWYHQVS